MNDITKYQTDHLILLVGSNPLPNWVAGKVLVKPNGKIYLVHSSKTEPIAIKLAEKFNEAYGEECCPEANLRDLGRDASSPEKVYKKIEGILNELRTKIKNSTQTVGLHYTGGTKVMSVQGYEAVLRQEQSLTVICSYLDAETLSLVVVGGKGLPDNWIPLGDSVKVSVEELMELHRNEFNKLPKKATTRLIKVSHPLINIHTVKSYHAEWRCWCNSYLKSDKPADLNPVQLPTSPNLVNVRTFLQQENPALRSFSLEEIGKVYGFAGKAIKNLAKWFDGEWLDDYTLQTLLQLKDELGLYQPGQDYDTKLFQFDVATTRGYQLFAFSCTTSDDKGLCKSKLFEAYIRAQQMGGDEAKTALVCCYDDVAKLEGDLSLEFGAKDKIKVFGRADLPHLKTRLKAWFDEIAAKQRREL